MVIIVSALSISNSAGFRCCGTGYTACVIPTAGAASSGPWIASAIDRALQTEEALLEPGPMGRLSVALKPLEAQKRVLQQRGQTAEARGMLLGAEATDDPRQSYLASLFLGNLEDAAGNPATRATRTLATTARLVNTGMGLPPVVVGLFVTILLWRNGALGFLELLYTPTAMVTGQFVIAAPIVTGLTLAAVQQVPEAFRLLMLGLGASRLQMIWVLLKQARLPMLAAVMAGFGGVISEVGASMMLGGNIRGSTRVLTTSVILLLITFLVNWALSWIQQRRRM